MGQGGRPWGPPRVSPSGVRLRSACWMGSGGPMRTTPRTTVRKEDEGGRSPPGQRAARPHGWERPPSAAHEPAQDACRPGPAGPPGVGTRAAPAGFRPDRDEGLPRVIWTNRETWTGREASISMEGPRGRFPRGRADYPPSSLPPRLPLVPPWRPNGFQGGSFFSGRAREVRAGVTTGGRTRLTPPPSGAARCATAWRSRRRRRPRRRCRRGASGSPARPPSGGPCG